MKMEKVIHQAFQDLGAEKEPRQSDPWRQIARKIEDQTAARKARSRRFVRTALSVLSIFLAGATVVYAYTRLMVDHGLQDADQNGLVSNFNQTAMPTVFNAVPEALAAAPLASDSKNGVTVTLEWAYMDESRLAYQLTLTGLSVPKGQNLGDFVCDPYLTDKQGVALNPFSSSNTVSQVQPGQPYEFVYVYYQHVDATQTPYLDLNLELTLGPCGPWWNFDQVYTGPGPTPTPPPLMGNYHLSFRVPVNKGVTIHPSQEITSNQVKMRLESVTFNPSYTEAELCFQQPDQANREWSPEEINLQINRADPIPADHFFAVQGSSTLQGGSCFGVGFVETVKPGSSLMLTVKNLQSFDGMDILLRSPDLQQALFASLAVEGIVIKFGDFNDPQGNLYWKVVKKPAGMNNQDIEAKVREFLTHRIPATWNFTISSTP